MWGTKLSWKINLENLLLWKLQTMGWPLCSGSGDSSTFLWCMVPSDKKGSCISIKILLFLGGSHIFHQRKVLLLVEQIHNIQSLVPDSQAWDFTYWQSNCWNWEVSYMPNSQHTNSWTQMVVSPRLQFPIFARTMLYLRKKRGQSSPTICLQDDE